MPESTTSSSPGASSPVNDEATDQTVQRALEKAQAARDKAEALREKAQALKEKAQDQAEAARDRAEAKAEAARARAEATAGKDSDSNSIIEVLGAPRIQIDRNHNSSMHEEALPIVAVVFLFGYLSIKAIANAFARRGAAANPPAAGRLSPEEQAVLAKLQRTIMQMETRVEALETILIDARRSSKTSYETKL